MSTDTSGLSARARLAAAIETFFVRHRDRLKYVHATMFAFFMVVILGPLVVEDAPAGATEFTHLRPFANYILWGLWFPLVLLSVIVTGRSWCGLLCPMGAAAEWGNKVGPQRLVPAWMRREGMPIASFVVVTILGQTLGVRTHAEAAAQIFGGTMLLAVIVGFFYGRRRRAWCRHLCPIGLLLGIFSRLGAVEFRPVIRLPGGDAYTDKGICPMMIDLPRKEESRHCIECFRCVNPGAKGGMNVVLRQPGSEVERIRDHHANPVEVWFLFLGTGIALGGFLWGILPLWQDLRAMAGEWAIGQGWYWFVSPGPGWLMSVHPDRREVYLWLDFVMISGFMLAIMLAVAAALTATTATAAALSGRGGGDRDFGSRFAELGYQYAPVAMVSLVVGLGGQLFTPLQLLAGSAAVGWAKGGLFLLGLAWSIWLGDRILRRQGVRPGLPRLVSLVPGVLGSLMVAAGWWPAIFGL